MFNLLSEIFPSTSIFFRQEKFLLGLSRDQVPSVIFPVLGASATGQLSTSSLKINMSKRPRKVQLRKQSEHDHQSWRLLRMSAPKPCSTDAFIASDRDVIAGQEMVIWNPANPTATGENTPHALHIAYINGSPTIFKSGNNHGRRISSHKIHSSFQFSFSKHGL